MESFKARFNSLFTARRTVEGRKVIDMPGYQQDFI